MTVPAQIVWDSNLTNTGTIPSGNLTDGYALNAIPTSTVFNTFWNNVSQRVKNIEGSSGSVNPLINSGFWVWPNGSSFTITSTANNNYTASNWVFQTDGTTIITQDSVSSTSVTPLTGSDFFANLNHTVVGAGTVNDFSNVYKGCGLYNGQIVTAAYAVANNTASSILVDIYGVQIFGTGGSPSTQVSTLLGSFTMPASSSGIYLTAGVALPSISGKVLGTNSDDTFWLTARVQPGTLNNVDFYTVGLYPGTYSVAPSYVPNSYYTELTACGLNIGSGSQATFPNSNYQIWQFGSTITIPNNSNVATADRCSINLSGTGGSGNTCVINSVPLSGTSLAPMACGSLLAYELNYTAAAGMTSPVAQYYRTLGDSGYYNGQEVVYSISVDNQSGSPYVLIPQWIQFFGTGGSPSTSTTTACDQTSITLPVGKSVASFTFSGANLIPSTSSKTLGTNRNDCARLIFNLNTSVSALLTFGYEKCEPGLIATPYTSKLYAEELANCQVYNNGGVYSSIAFSSYMNDLIQPIVPYISGSGSRLIIIPITPKMIIPPPSGAINISAGVGYPNLVLLYHASGGTTRIPATIQSTTGIDNFSLLIDNSYFSADDYQVEVFWSADCGIY